MPDHRRYLDLVGEIVQVFPLNDPGTYLGHKPFIAIGEFAEEVIGNNSTEYRIAQILQPFVIN